MKLRLLPALLLSVVSTVPAQAAALGVPAKTVSVAVWEATEAAAEKERQIRLRRLATPSAVDLSEYRINTYGPPNAYCDLTKTATGTGTIDNPYNPAQCKSQPVCSDVFGVIEFGGGANGTINPFSSAGLDTQEPAFRPTNAAVQGTSCGSSANGVVYVARYPAITMVNLADLSASTIASNANRSEIRHDGVADAGDVVSGTGQAAYGCYNQSYVTFDGFYSAMAHNGQSGDQGHIGFQSDSAAVITECRAKNFAAEGDLTDMDSNAVFYRPGNALRSLLSNFVMWDFDNEPTGVGLNQDGLASDSYGDRDFLIERFLLQGVERGFYTKGCPSGTCNYGTYRYGIVRNTGGGPPANSVGECFRISALHATEQTRIHNVLLINCEQAGIQFTAEGGSVQNLLVDHITIANMDGGCAGALSAQSNITTAQFEIRDSIFDIAAACSGHMIDAGGSNAFATSMHHNAYFDADGTYTWSFNGAEQTSLAQWRTATGLTETGSSTISDPFISRTPGNANYYKISALHAALTMSSTGGEIGAYGGTSETIGPITQ